MTNKLKVKVCGMKDFDNIKSLLNLEPDFMGMIFYKKSARNIPQDFILPDNIPTKTKIVGVFVHEDIELVIETTRKYNLKYVQLHGREAPIYCENLKKRGLTLIKVFSISDNFDFGELKVFENCVDYFLFDTKGKNPGGNGIQFNWGILNSQPINKPFFLSGGIEPSDMNDIIELKKNMPNLIGVDINSGFEISPGLKNIDEVSTFINEFRL